MYEERLINLFHLQVDFLVAPVNCFGTMGAGLALQFAQLFPGLEEEYRLYCRKKVLKPGICIVCLSFTPAVVLFPTKWNWRQPSTIRLIEAGLQDFVQNCGQFAGKSIGFPKLGCGYGGLRWKEDIQPIMRKYLSNLPMQVCVCLEEGDL